MSTVHKAVALLALIAEADRPLRFSELARASGHPKATLHRLLTTLVEERLVRSDAATQTYRPGLRLLELAHYTWSSLDLRAVAADQVDRLSRRTGEIVHLALLDGTDIIYIDKRDSAKSLRLRSAVGKRGPLYCTGLGKALLAFKEADERRAILRNIKTFAHTANTLTERAELCAELAAVRKRGFAFDLEEHEEGIRCVAAPIMDHDNRVAAALSVTAPAARMDQAQMDALQPLVMECAASVSRHLSLLH